MTAQLPEILFDGGERLSMCSEPLTDYFAMGGCRPDFGKGSTALWRRYVGTWEIRRSRLYLMHIEARTEHGALVTLEDLFPGFPGRVFAHWFSGQLRIPQGGLLEYRHMGYGSIYERDLLIDIARGVETSRTIRDNRVVCEAEALKNHGIPGIAEAAQDRSGSAGR